MKNSRRDDQSNIAEPVAYHGNRVDHIGVVKRLIEENVRINGYEHTACRGRPCR